MQERGDEPSLEDLLIRYRDSDPEAFRAFYRRTKNLVFHFLQRQIKNRADAEEVFQETYFRVHRYVASYDPSRNGIVWLLSIARNAMYDRLKARRRLPELDNGAVASSVSPLKTDDVAAFRSLLEHACKSMTDEEIDLLYRRVFLEESFEEIAEGGAFSPANARQKMSRLLRRLRSGLS